MTSLYLPKISRWLLSSPPAERILSILKDLLIGALRQGPVPQHVAFVMDGNRRFARTHGIETVEGHNLGFEALARILEVCYRAGVKHVTIYAFSIENFKRSKYEVDALMDMAKVKLGQLAQHGALLDRYGASIRILGQRELVKQDVLDAMDEAVNLTKHNTQAVLNVCFPYTSREEITTAIRTTVAAYSQPLQPSSKPYRQFSASHIAQTIRARRLSVLPEESSSDMDDTPPSQSQPNTTSTTSSPSASSTTLTHDSPPLSPTSPHALARPYPHLNHPPTYPDPETITAATLTSAMFTAGSPPLDLVVRTSGVARLSDFMLWQCHETTSIVFVKCLWPEFDLWRFLPVLVEWQWWRRRAEDEGRVVKTRPDVAPVVQEHAKVR